MASLSFPFFSFPFLSYYFLAHLHISNGKPISVVDGSNDAILRKEVPFWGFIEKI
jgi:hypothetical protein